MSTKKSKPKRKTITLDYDVYENLKQISVHSGYTIQEVISLAVMDLLAHIQAECAEEEKPLIETGPGLIIPERLK